MKINKYLPFALIYFFVNSLGLPFGLTYTALLTPFLYYWVIMRRKQEILVPFFSILAPFLIAHLFSGYDPQSYFISFLNLTTVYIFCQAFYTFLLQVRKIEDILEKILIINFALCLIAIPLYFTPYYYIFWIKQDLTKGVSNFLRLKMFTYEASYYATLFTPVFFFFFLQVILKKNKIKVVWLLPMLVLPYLMSFSMGVISCILLSCALTYIFHFRNLTRQVRVVNLALLTFFASLLTLVIIIVFFPENIFFQRIENVFLGEDVSGKSRTTEAFLLGSQILKEKSFLWGIGLGQIKMLGADIIRDYYSYQPDFNIIAIPNAAAETLVVFGWIGFVVRMIVEIVLFVQTKVWTNYYRLFLFLFIFIYQFTGSFITNLAEYVIWIIAFTNTFQQFDVKSYKKLRKQ
jgi:hypothetical protein